MKQKNEETQEKMKQQHEQLRREKGTVQVGEKTYPLYDIERAQTIIRHWLMRRKFKHFNAKIGTTNIIKIKKQVVRDFYFVFCFTL
jgi:hypothetical protein